MQNVTWACFECRLFVRRTAGQLLIGGQHPVIGQTEKKSGVLRVAALADFLGGRSQCPAGTR